MNERLKRMRGMVGMSQFEVSNRTKIGRTRLSLFENGYIELAPWELKALGDVLNTAASELVCAVDSMSRNEAVAI